MGEDVYRPLDARADNLETRAVPPAQRRRKQRGNQRRARALPDRLPLLLRDADARAGAPDLAGGLEPDDLPLVQ
eukprot:3106119-Rhodomonas_salina.1